MVFGTFRPTSVFLDIELGLIRSWGPSFTDSFDFRVTTSLLQEDFVHKAENRLNSISNFRFAGPQIWAETSPEYEAEVEGTTWKYPFWFEARAENKMQFCVPLGTWCFRESLQSHIFTEELNEANKMLQRISSYFQPRNRETGQVANFAEFPLH